LSFLFLTIMSGLFAKTYPFASLDSVKQLCSVTGLGTWEYQFSAVSIPNFLHIE
jgi:hypothetical protein